MLVVLPLAPCFTCRPCGISVITLVVWGGGAVSGVVWDSLCVLHDTLESLDPMFVSQLWGVDVCV